MTYAFSPRGFLGRPLKLLGADEDGPLRGNDVIALQTACGLSEQDTDGIFGRQTHDAVKALQSMLNIKVDGISGPGTEKAYCLFILTSVGRGVPAGLPRGIIEGESGYRFGAQSPTYVRSGVLKADLGAVQFSTSESDEEAVLRALDPAQGIARLCSHLQDKRAEYYDASFVARHRERERIAGWLACGSWNAPAWTDVWAKRGPDDSFLQVRVTLQDGSPGTREQWIRNYVRSKLAYVESWHVN